jgi:hypothetical protein
MIKQIRNSDLDVVCSGCRAVNTYLISDLQAGVSLVAFPWCAACGQVRIVVNVIDGPVDKHGEDARARQAAIKAVHRRLVEMGRLADGVVADAISADAYVDATVWPEEGTVVDVPVPMGGQ